MKKHEDSQEQTPEKTEDNIDTSEVSDEELDEVSGGIIIVSGKQSFKSQFNKYALNPQPLPPKFINPGQ
ncbi:MAG: hypothetical protein JWP00_3038 [Chloroflexi bacterium]|jgi:hypothetical protein|nr:hypothetical protein [Chloroflexota bacterium]